MKDYIKLCYCINQLMLNHDFWNGKNKSSFLILIFESYFTLIIDKVKILSAFNVVTDLRGVRRLSIYNSDFLVSFEIPFSSMFATEFFVFVYYPKHHTDDNEYIC